MIALLGAIACTAVPEGDGDDDILTFGTTRPEPTDTTTAPPTDSTPPPTDTDTSPPGTTITGLHGTLPPVALPPPEFAEVLAMTGEPRSQADLIGAPTVLWFYPAAFTGG